MIQIDGLDAGLEIFKVLGSDVRMKIIELVSHSDGMNLNELAAALKITNGAVTSHVRKLEEAGIINVEMRQTAHGKQNICTLREDQLLLNESSSSREANTKIYETEVNIGLYSDYAAGPVCGLAGREKMIGMENDPRVFAYPERVEAEMLWLRDGFVEYRIPNLLPEGQRIVQLTLSFEISSAVMGEPDGKASFVRFFLNGFNIGQWETIVNTNSSRGIYTPAWWDRTRCQHGYLKMIVLNNAGVFLDGVRMGPIGPDWDSLDSQGEMKLRFEVASPEGADGGMALYGTNFGNYKQSIRARVHYMPEEAWHGFTNEI